MRQDVHFYSDGYRLAAEYFLPEGIQPGEKRPGLIMCHGFGGIKKFFLGDFAQFFSAAGYTVLTFDYRGFGESDGPRWRLNPFEQVADIRNAITYLQTRDEVDPKRIGLYGTSAGGGNVVYTAGVDERVRCTVCSVGFGDGERWLRSLRRHWEWCTFLERLQQDRVQRVLTGKSEWVEPEEIMVRDPHALEHDKQLRARFPDRAFKLPLESADALIEFKPESLVDRIAPRAIMFIGVEQDWLVPTEETLSLYSRAKEPKRLMLMPPIGHHGVYYGDALTQVLGGAREWFDLHLNQR